MTEKIRAQISASVDNELQPHEWELLAKRLYSEPALKTTWGRYHLIGDAMHNSLAPFNVQEFNGRVMSALELENQPKQRLSRRRTAGLAMAASVALAAVGFAGYYEGSEPAQHGALPGISSVAAASGEHDGQWDEAPAPIQQQLNNLLISHTDYTLSLRRQPILPYVHVAADAGRPRGQVHSNTAVVRTVADEPPQ